MSLTIVPPYTTTFDDLDEQDVAATPSVDDWLRLMYGLRPGVSRPRFTRGAVHPACVPTAGWLHALWGAGV
jgi:hypothetical protein